MALSTPNPPSPVSLPSGNRPIPRLFPETDTETGRTPDWLAGAPGFEPGNGGIKILCLTTWLRPITPRLEGKQVTYVDRTLKGVGVGGRLEAPA